MRHLTTHLQRQVKQERARELRAAPTRAEARAWHLLRNRQVLGLKFRRQHVIGDFIVDFYCHGLRLALEIDGGVHDDADQRQYDEAREAILRGHQVTVLRIRNEDISRARLSHLLAPFAQGAPDHLKGRG